MRGAQKICAPRQKCAPFRVNLNERSIFRILVKALPFMEILTDINKIIC